MDAFVGSNGVLTTILLSIVTTSGFWSGFWVYFQRRRDKNDAIKTLVLGMAHNMIVTQGYQYMEQGYLRIDEYESYKEHLVTPYLNSGGNGLAKKVFSQVEELPVLQRHIEIKEDQNGTTQQPSKKQWFPH